MATLTEQTLVHGDRAIFYWRHIRRACLIRLYRESKTFLAVHYSLTPLFRTLRGKEKYFEIADSK